MKPLSTLTLCTGALLAAGLFAQTGEQKPAQGTAQTERTFAVVERSSMRTFQGSWQPSAPIFRYVKDHPGSYVVFSQQGALYRLDRPDQMAEVERMYAPMQELSTKQDALAQVQKPLARNQQDLASQQRDTSNPMQKGRIGEAQGAIGQEQGDLGAMQGELGRQQGEVAKAAYKRMQVLFNQCLSDGSCQRIGS